ncbi:NUDIX domain-containing protein [Nonomuraea sp. NPDC050404]|uniref:NUDIX hydrolase n=1 Tax=Nonomuraea sp. NPDC050404 TaxID=3155783 RepID=UPI003402136D
MPITRDHIRTSVDAYLTHHPNERQRLTRLLQALTTPGNLTRRGTFTGHVTCSAILINADERVLHIHHAALDRLLLPGGHLEDADAHLQAAALRELEEETGLARDGLIPEATLSGLPLDIDIHQIPASPAKAEPAHLHFDFRFAFRTGRRGEPAIRLQREEVSSYRWAALADVSSPTVASKLAQLLPALSYNPGTAP